MRLVMVTISGDSTHFRENDTLWNYLIHFLALEDIIIRDLVLADVISQVVTIIAEEGGMTPGEEADSGA